MGLFSKKTVICECCGKEYEVRLAIGEHICDECMERQSNKRQLVSGYINYAASLSLPPYTEEQMDQIMEHRIKILEKYRMTEGISREELQRVSDNYKQLTDEQAADILHRISNSSLSANLGAAYTTNFFVPTDFSGLIVDVEDVIAVGYTNDYRFGSYNQEVLLCAIFTKDPYVPVFPMVYVAKLGFFEVTKSKKGREGIHAIFTLMCPNLAYPVQELKSLKKQIKADGSMAGIIDMKFALKLISMATDNLGIFDTKKMLGMIWPETALLLDEFGYIQESQINEILKMDKKPNRKYWEKQIQRLSN